MLFNNLTITYSYAISTINDFCYTDEQREESLKSRRLSKNVNICVVNDVRKRYKKIKQKDLLEETNKILIENGHKKISLSSLKRHLKELKNMSEDDIKELYDDVEYTINERKQDLLDALESSDENSKKVKNCKKRLKQVNIRIKEGV